MQHNIGKTSRFAKILLKAKHNDRYKLGDEHVHFLIFFIIYFERIRLFIYYRHMNHRIRCLKHIVHIQTCSPFYK